MTLANPVNYIEFQGPYTDGVTMQFTPQAIGLAPFRINYSETLFDPNGLADPVMQWGYNINDGGGLVEAGKPGIGLQIEGNYDVGHARYVEQHLLYVDDTGLQHRPWSWRINTAPAGAWDYMLHLSTMRLWERNDAANPFFAVGPESLFWLPGKVNGEPASGMSMSGANNNIAFNKVGPDPMALIYNGWNSVNFPGVTIYGAGSNAGSVDASGWIKGSRLISYSDVWAEGGLTFRPATAITPNANGQATFELTSDTSLTIKVRGSDGVVRSAVLTLS